MSCGLAAERCLARRVERIAANGEPSRMVWKFVRERLRGSERGNLSRSPLRRLPLALSTAEQHASRPPKLQTCDSLRGERARASESEASRERSNHASRPVAIHSRRGRRKRAKRRPRTAGSPRRQSRALKPRLSAPSDSLRGEPARASESEASRERSNASA